ncbi:hypothetical protein C922_05741 [Plasmodium inui San Antonio 1]|uniref:Uncharacterized protein n=1 Tax=Plasmodium inui San Antonio 1 TaxID=1237626 RepID=W7AF24_9APIC|nr:hypothetical protein C922_05741 [Plasmodium inui San Antonio 1]EUD63876.1 hypothetical protein C922_05741 [Plasmodium inui San Antonio 1]
MANKRSLIQGPCSRIRTAEYKKILERRRAHSPSEFAEENGLIGANRGGIVIKELDRENSTPEKITTGKSLIKSKYTGQFKKNIKEYSLQYGPEYSYVIIKNRGGNNRAISPQETA